MERGLVIRTPWIKLILQGKKTWEMRSVKTKIRGAIGLIEKGTGLVVGTARLVDSLPPLSRQTYKDHYDKHGIPEAMLDEVVASGWVYPWVLEDARLLPVAVPYEHKSGAVTFVLLDILVSEEIARQSAGAPTADRPLVAARSETAVSSAAPHSPAKVATAAAETRTATPPRSVGSETRYAFRPERAQAYGHPEAEGRFRVEAGSTAMRVGSPRVKRDRPMRDQLVTRGILVPDSDPKLFRFAVNHDFSSASQAAGVVKDGNASGPNLWIDETTGKSLRESSP